MAPQIMAKAVLNPGCASGPLMALDEALSFWGGYDPSTGRILDTHHPQAGQSVSGKILVMPSSRGSAGTPAALAESLRRRVGPVGLVLTAVDVNIAVGAMVADRLYAIQTPVVAVNLADEATLRTWAIAQIRRDGSIASAE